MADNIFKTLVYENPSGVQTILSSPAMTNYWEVGRRKGFTAPSVKIITQKYVNGNVRIVNTIKEPRTVSVTMILTGKTEASRDKYFHDMVDRLMDVSKGDVGKLYIMRSDGLKVHLNCAYASGLDVVDQYKNLSKFTLEFYAADPYFYGVESIQTAEWSEGDMLTLSQTLTLGAWCLGWGNLATTKLLTNKLYGAVDPIYEIEGIRKSIVLRNASVKTFIEFDGLEMKSGDTLIIDTRERYKRAYIRHEDGTETTAMGALRWKTISLSLPVPSGESYLSAESVGENYPLNVVMMNQYLSA